MDQNQQVIDQVLKDKIKQLFGKKALEILRIKKEPYSSIREMAIFVTTELPNIKTQSELISFLDDVSNDFPFLMDEVSLLKKEANLVKEQIVINKLAHYIKNLPTTST